MTQYFRKHLIAFMIVFTFAIFVALSYANDWSLGIVSLNNLGNSALEMLGLLPVMFILIGLFEVWVPRELVTKHTGDKAGIMSIFWLILLAMLQVGPLYGAFPVAYALWRKGTSVRNVFIYLGAFSTLKLPMLSFEIGFLGLKFTLLRTALSLPVIILIAYIMDRMFANKFTMNQS